MTKLGIFCCLFCVNIGQISEWYGYNNGNEYELYGLNDGYIIEKICVRYGWIIDSIGNVTWNNGYQRYINTSMYGGNGGSIGCFKTSCIHSITVLLGKYWNTNVIAGLTFFGDNNLKEFGGTSIDDPPTESYTFNCDVINNKYLSKINVKVTDNNLRRIKFECGSIGTLHPSMYVHL